VRRELKSFHSVSCSMSSLTCGTGN
jgi:hypothetical protein